MPAVSSDSLHTRVISETAQRKTCWPFIEIAGKVSKPLALKSTQF